MTATKIRPVQATAPERIYLQGGPQLPPETEFGALSEVTWCRDDVDGVGIPYVRADLAGAAPAAVAGWGCEDRSAWYALAMGAAASLEDAANCLRDKDAQKAAMGSATHVRESCNKLWWSVPALEAPAAESDEMALRRMLCIAYSGALAYMDDGEMQDSRCCPSIDFKRDTVDEIAAKFVQRSSALAAAPQAQASAPDWWRGRADEIEVQVAATGNSEAMRCYTDMRTLLQAAAAPQAPAQEAPAAPACPYTGFAARYWTLGYQGHDCPPTTGPVSREAYDAGALLPTVRAPQAPAAPSGLPWRTGIPPWTDDRAVRVIAVTAHDDFGGVQVHDIRASDFHTDGDGDGAEVARVCTHWAYRDDIWPRADAAAPAAPAVDAKAHDWRENASYGGEICAECGAAKGSRRGNAPCAWPPEPLDVCTDPYNCARCKTHPAHRGDMHHAGISRIGGSA